MLELVIVIAVTVLLTGMLLPTLSKVRENVHRILCSSNQRQIGLGIVMWARDDNDRLPESRVLTTYQQPELLHLARLDDVNKFDCPEGWDGLGRLFYYKYCGAAECYYCPSHTGFKTLDKGEWGSRAPTRIATNYHYGGHVEWDTFAPRDLRDGSQLVLAVDVLPTNGIVNHEAGLNTLRGDGSVLWQEGENDRIVAFLEDVEEGGTNFKNLWRTIERQRWRERR